MDVREIRGSRGNRRGEPQQIVLNFIRHFALACGAQYVGGVSCVVPVSGEARKRGVEVGQALVEAIKGMKHCCLTPLQYFFSMNSF